MFPIAFVIYLYYLGILGALAVVAFLVRSLFLKRAAPAEAVHFEADPVRASLREESPVMLEVETEEEREERLRELERLTAAVELARSERVRVLSQSRSARRKLKPDEKRKVSELNALIKRMLAQISALEAKAQPIAHEDH